MQKTANVMKHLIPPTLLAGGTALWLQTSAFAGGFDWPQWRGPDRTDVSRETGLLKDWPAGGPKRLWLYKSAGNGYSGPAIANGKLFTMGTRDGSEIMIALNPETDRKSVV